MNCPSCGSDAQKKVGNGPMQRMQAVLSPYHVVLTLEVLQVITDGIEKFIEVSGA